MDKLMKFPEPIQVKDELLDVIDLDDVKTAEDIVYEWDQKVKRQLYKHFSTENQYNLYRAMEWYLGELKREVSEFKDLETLKNLLPRHVKFLETMYKRLDSFSNTKYLTLMEDILTCCCNTTLEYVTQKKKDVTKTQIKKIVAMECRRLKCLLTQCMLDDHERVLHVLIKVDIDPSSQPCRDLLNHLFGHFLTRKKQPESDVSFCRGYIIFQKWKLIRKPEERPAMDQCMYNMYNKTPGCIQTNPMFQKILLPSSNSVLDLGRKITDNIVDMSKEYFRYIRTKENEEGMEFNLDINGLSTDRVVDWEMDENDEDFECVYNVFEEELETAKKQTIEVVEPPTVKNETSEEECVIVSVGNADVNVDNTVMLTELLDDDDIDQITYYVKKDRVQEISNRTSTKLRSFLDTINTDEVRQKPKATEKTKTPSLTPKLIQIVDIEPTVTETVAPSVENAVEPQQDAADPKHVEQLEKPTTEDETVYPSCSYFILTPPSDQQVEDRSAPKSCVYTNIINETPDSQTNSESEYMDAHDENEDKSDSKTTETDSRAESPFTPEETSSHEQDTEELLTDSIVHENDTILMENPIEEPQNTTSEKTTSSKVNLLSMTKFSSSDSYYSATDCEYATPMDSPMDARSDRETASPVLVSVSSLSDHFNEVATLEENITPEVVVEAEEIVPEQEVVQELEVLQEQPEETVQIEEETEEEVVEEPHSDPKKVIVENRVMYTSPSQLTSFVDNLSVDARWDAIKDGTDLEDIFSGPVTKLQGHIVNPDENFDLFECDKTNGVVCERTPTPINNNNGKKCNGIPGRESLEDLLSPDFEAMDDFRTFFHQGGEVREDVTTRQYRSPVMRRRPSYAPETPTENRWKRVMFADHVQTSDDNEHQLTPSKKSKTAPKGILKSSLRIPPTVVNLNSLRHYRVALNDVLLQGEPKVCVEKLPQDEINKWLQLTALTRRILQREESKKKREIIRVDYDKTTPHINEKDVARFTCPGGSRSIPFVQYIGQYKKTEDEENEEFKGMCQSDKFFFDAENSCGSLSGVFENLNVAAMEEELLRRRLELRDETRTFLEFQESVERDDSAMEICSPLPENPLLDCSDSLTSLDNAVGNLDGELDNSTLILDNNTSECPQNLPNEPLPILPDFESPSPDFDIALPDFTSESPEALKIIDDNRQTNVKIENFEPTCVKTEGVDRKCDLKRPYAVIDSCKSLLENFDAFTQEPSDIPKLKKEIQESECEVKLPLKKRKMSVALEKSEVEYLEEMIKEASKKDIDEMLKEATKEISYPATPMLSIADVQEQEKFPRPFKTAAERKEIPPVDYNVLREPPQIVTEQYNNHTYNNPTINYHMNSPFPPQPFSFNYACTPVAYFSLLPINGTTTFTSTPQTASVPGPAHQQSLFVPHDIMTGGQSQANVVPPAAHQTTLLLAAQGVQNEGAAFNAPTKVPLPRQPRQTADKTKKKEDEVKRRRGRPRKQKIA